MQALQDLLGGEFKALSAPKKTTVEVRDETTSRDVSYKTFLPLFIPANSKLDRLSL
jgi:hypothetical protein